MKIGKLRRSATREIDLKEIRSLYSASLIQQSSRLDPMSHISHKSLQNVENYDSKKTMILYNEVFINENIPKPPNIKKKLKSLKSRPADFFYQLLAVEVPILDLTLSDLLCLSELGIPKDDYQKKAFISILIGDKYEKIHKSLSALKFYSKAFKASDAIFDQIGISIALNRLGNSYYNIGRFIKARNMHKRHKKICNQDFIPLYNLGIINRALKKFKKSSQYLLKALNISEGHNQEEMCIANAQLGLTYKAMNEYGLAKHSLVLSAKIAKIIRACEIMIEVNIALGYLAFHVGELKESEECFFSAMKSSVGDKSEICRINAGILRGEKKLRINFPDYETCLVKS